jgi:hypothetical protein
MKILTDEQLQNLNTQRLTALRQRIRNTVSFLKSDFGGCNFDLNGKKLIAYKPYLKAINKLLRTREQNDEK